MEMPATDKDTNLTVNINGPPGTDELLEDDLLSLEGLFRTVLEVVRTETDTTVSWKSNSDLPTNASLSVTDRLQLYGYYKQATVGPCPPDQSVPSIWNTTAYSKHQAWIRCRDLTREQAMQSYIEFLATQTHTRVGETVALLWNSFRQDRDETVGLGTPSSTSKLSVSTIMKAETETVATSPPPASTAAAASTSTATPSTATATITTKITSTNRTMALNPHPQVFSPRGRFDITYSDLAFAAKQCIQNSILEKIPWLVSLPFGGGLGVDQKQSMEQRVTEEWINQSLALMTAAPIVIGFSARTLMDLYLRVHHFPDGSEVIICPPITVPGMVKVWEHHRLKLVPVDILSSDYLAVDCDAIERAITKRTVAICVVHVWGMITSSERDMDHLADICQRNHLQLWEDCAESYGGSYRGHFRSDLILFSFGFIKTATALGGGIAVVKDAKIQQAMNRLQLTHYERQSIGSYAWKMGKCYLLQILADQPLVCGWMASLCGYHQWDQWVTALLRGFSFQLGGEKNNTENAALYMAQIRKYPSKPLLAVLHRRIQQLHGNGSSNSVHRRRKICTKLTDSIQSQDLSLPQYLPRGDHTYWLFPVLVKDPTDAVTSCRHLFASGYDVTQGASQLSCVGRSRDCPRSWALMQRALYLPISNLSHTSLELLIRTLNGRIEQIHLRPSASWRGYMWHTLAILFLIFLTKYSAFVHILWSGIVLILFISLMIFATNFVLSWYMSSIYINSSEAFAKYSQIFCESRGADFDTCDIDSNSVWKIIRLPESIESTPRTVVLTGATGFLGSKFLRDMLKHRQHLSIERIVLICRPKGDESALTRVNKLLSRPIFSFISEKERVSLIEVLEGDVTKRHAGLSDDEVRHLGQKWSITHVFNCAANVTFTQSLTDAARTNIFSALNLQSLTGQLSSTAKFVHISTAFVHGGLSGSPTEPLQEELFSLHPYDPVELYRSMCGSQYYASKAMIELRFPNVYTFSKCIAEHLLSKSAVTTVILRPSIVGPSVQDPWPGWSGSKPSTMVAAASLYLAYQWNLWFFGRHTVPCVPVDILSLYIVRKSFHNEVCGSIKSEQESVSSDEGFQKVHVSLSEKESTSRQSDQSTAPSCRIINAAWDVSSPAGTQFMWTDYAHAITQAGSVLGHFSRTTAYLGLLLATQVMPYLCVSQKQFESLHNVIVLRPYLIICRIRRTFGCRHKSIEKIGPFLDLPILFFPFTSKSFYFESDMVAPTAFSGEQYSLQCVAAARGFITTSNLSKPELHWHRIAGSKIQKVWSDATVMLSEPRFGLSNTIAAWALTIVMDRCFSSVTVDIPSFSDAYRDLTQHSPPCRVVLCPTHRSLFDFLLLSHALFSLPELRIGLPYILAADDFENIPIIGTLVRYLGAVFVSRRRGVPDVSISEKIKGTPLGAPLEVFFEGARSRDRRFLRPKTGVLKCLMELDEDCLLIPVTISYEGLADQSALSSEAASGYSKGLNIDGLFSWMLKLVKGEVKLGRVHIAAGRSLCVSSESPEHAVQILDELQRRQGYNLFVSSYHAHALAAVLGLDYSVAHDALRHLGSKFFPASTNESDALLLPTDRNELWSIALQNGPSIAPLVSTSHPEWSRWLDRLCDHPAHEGVLNEPAVKILTTSLVHCFDAAMSSIEDALARLAKKGFNEVELEHVIEIAHSVGDIPRLLLRSAAAIKRVGLSVQRSPQIAKRPLPLSSITKQVYLQSGEKLGFWGFAGSGFVVRVDCQSGKPYVTLQGDHYSLSCQKLTKLIPFIEKEMKIQIDWTTEAFQHLNECEDQFAPPCRLNSQDLLILNGQVAALATEYHERVRHCTGHAQADVFMIRARHSFRLPDVVVWPNSEDGVLGIVALAKQRNWCLIPYGGGTNVSQALKCPSLEEEPRPIISVDMMKLNRIVSVDEENGVAHVEAGITGRVLVEELGRRGYTLGHEPDSYEFSTLGGWIATKASGMKRNRYGNIEDIVLSVHVAGPNGLCNYSGCKGRQSTGLDLNGLILGSEGCLGIITSALIRIWPRASTTEYDSILFPDLDHGLRFVREMSKKSPNGIPASVRLLDNAHFRLGRALKSNADESWWHHACQIAAISLVGDQLDPGKVVCVTLLYEGSRDEVNGQIEATRNLMRRLGGVRVGAAVGKRGYEMTFLIAYLRDFAMTYYILGESFETTVSWSNIRPLIAAVEGRIVAEHAERCLPGKPFVGCRITQLYHDSVCLYFYLCIYVKGVPEASAVFSSLEHAAREEILKHGGSLSHHHGVGKVRSSFLKDIDSAPWHEMKHAVKHAIDPTNVFGARNGAFATQSSCSDR